MRWREILFSLAPPLLQQQQHSVGPPGSPPVSKLTVNSEHAQGLRRAASWLVETDKYKIQQSSYEVM